MGPWVSTVLPRIVLPALTCQQRISLCIASTTKIHSNLLRSPNHSPNPSLSLSNLSHSSSQSDLHLSHSDRTVTWPIWASNSKHQAHLSLTPTKPAAVLWASTIEILSSSNSNQQVLSHRSRCSSTPSNRSPRMLRTDPRVIRLETTLHSRLNKLHPRRMLLLPAVAMCHSSRKSAS